MSEQESENVRINEKQWEDSTEQEVDTSELLRPEEFQTPQSPYWKEPKLPQFSSIVEVDLELKDELISFYKINGLNNGEKVWQRQLCLGIAKAYKLEEPSEEVKELVKRYILRVIFGNRDTEITNQQVLDETEKLASKLTTMAFILKKHSKPENFTTACLGRNQLDKGLNEIRKIGKKEEAKREEYSIQEEETEPRSNEKEREGIAKARQLALAGAKKPQEEYPIMKAYSEIEGFSPHLDTSFLEQVHPELIEVVRRMLKKKHWKGQTKLWRKQLVLALARAYEYGADDGLKVKRVEGYILEVIGHSAGRGYDGDINIVRQMAETAVSATALLKVEKKPKQFPNHCYKPLNEKLNKLINSTIFKKEQEKDDKMMEAMDKISWPNWEEIMAGTGKSREANENSTPSTTTQEPSAQKESRAPIAIDETVEFFSLDKQLNLVEEYRDSNSVLTTDTTPLAFKNFPDTGTDDGVRQLEKIVQEWEESMAAAKTVSDEKQEDEVLKTGMHLLGIWTNPKVSSSEGTEEEENELRNKDTPDENDSNETLLGTAANETVGNLSDIDMEEESRQLTNMGRDVRFRKYKSGWLIGENNFYG